MSTAAHIDEHGPTVDELLAEGVLAVPAPFDTLSERELQVARRLAVGAINKEIAAELGINVKTIDTHRGKVMTKLNLRHNVDLARLALRVGLVSLFEE